MKYKCIRCGEISEFAQNKSTGFCPHCHAKLALPKPNANLESSYLITDYNDSKQQQKSYPEDIQTLQESTYSKAKSWMLTADTPEKFNEAAMLFESIKDFKESSDYAEQCRRVAFQLSERKQNSNANHLPPGLRKPRWSQALNILLILLLFLQPFLFWYIGNRDPIPSQSETENTNTSTSDVATQYITFGHYEQDNDLSNGKEEIRWRVLDKKNGQMLVISEKALDCQPYNMYDSGSTWDTCSLRTWLNVTFYNSAFTEQEKERIVPTTITAERNPQFPYNNAGNDTKDKIFLLSVQEANELLPGNSDRLCSSTQYCDSNGVFHSKEYPEYCWWWLRSLGHYTNDASHVFDDGSIHVSGYWQAYSRVGVRPAMWVKME